MHQRRESGTDKHDSLVDSVHSMIEVITIDRTLLTSVHGLVHSGKRLIAAAHKPFHQGCTIEGYDAAHHHILEGIFSHEVSACVIIADEFIAVRRIKSRSYRSHNILESSNLCVLEIVVLSVEIKCCHISFPLIDDAKVASKIDN